MKHAAKQTRCAHPPCQSFHFASLFALLIQHFTFIFHLFASLFKPHCNRLTVCRPHRTWMPFRQVMQNNYLAHTSSQDFPLHLNLHYLQSNAKCCLTLMAYARMCDDFKYASQFFLRLLNIAQIAQQRLLSS